MILRIQYTSLLKLLLLTLLLLAPMVCAGENDRDQDDGGPGHEREKDEQTTTYSSPSDIMLMMGIAFGWVIFVIRSFYIPTMAKYATEGIRVKGHVLESRVDYHDSASILSYRVLVDYILRLPSGNTVQVRKAFATEAPVEQGFSNISLIVLPSDPTSGLLVDQWEREYDREKRECLSPKRVKMATLTIAGAFVGLATLQAYNALLRLPSSQLVWGYILLGTCVTLLVPAAIYFYKLATKCWMFRQSVDEGMILFKKDYKDDDCNPISCGAVACIPGEGEDDGSFGQLSPATTPRHSNRRRGQDDESQQPQQQQQRDTDFYFVCMPMAKKDNRSFSTVSSLSVEQSIIAEPDEQDTNSIT
jgi:hypothetical protein